MSKPPTEPRDWSGASEALFRAARTDHAPNAADRQRVRSELAQRLADASNPPLAGSDSPLEAASRSGVALSTLAKIGLGVVVVVAGTLGFMRLRESQQAEPKQVTQTSAKTAPSIPVPAPVVTSSEPPMSPVAPVQNAAPAPAARRSSGRAPSANVAIRQHRGPGPEANRARNSLDATGEPASAAPVADATRKEATGKPSAADPQQTSIAQNPMTRGDESSTARAPEKTEDDSAHRSATHAESSVVPRDSSERVATTAELDPSDPRAELVFARRIQAAMLAGKPGEVMALCSEHERLWPHGTFVQEREGLRAMASCFAEARDAKARASRFLATYPRGPLVPRVRQACADQLE